MRTPCETRFALPLVIAFTPERPWPTRSWRTLGNPRLATPTSSASATSPTTALLPQTSAAATTTPLASETKLDCEKERNSPPHVRSEEHTSELQSQSNLVCRLLLEKKKRLRTL